MTHRRVPVVVAAVAGDIAAAGTGIESEPPAPGGASIRLPYKSSCNFAVPVRMIIRLVPVVFPMESLQIVQIIRTALGHRLYVVYLPSPLLRFSIPAPQHGRSASILAETGESQIRNTLLPYGLNGRFVKRLAPAVCIWFFRHMLLLVFLLEWSSEDLCSKMKPSQG
jgi:hypothetical protein